MEKKTVCIDTSILIDYYRKKDKTKSLFYMLTSAYEDFSVSIITEYEILIGSNDNASKFWRSIFDEIKILSYDKKVNHHAVNIYKDLKRTSKLIDIPDIIIAATALAHNLSIATLNKKHFSRIQHLHILDI